LSSHKVRYSADGAVIGTREFVDEIFQKSRERFGPKWKTGARTLKGSGGAAAGQRQGCYVAQGT
jgi:hypothetical protein